MNHSLIISYRDKIIFTSDAHWLYPLFEFRDFLSKNKFDVSQLFLHDKIAGKAAASMIVRLGIKKCHIELISERAIPVFVKAGITFTYSCKVEQIDCCTEELINDKMSVDEIWLFLSKRAGRVGGWPLKIENLTVDIGSHSILKCLNMNLLSGGQIVVHGTNGSGKTTLLKTILGLVKPFSGIITVGNYKVGSEEWKSNRVNTAYVPQDNVKNTFPVSAGEVVSIGLSGSKKTTSEIFSYKVEVAMRRTGCFELFKRSYHSLSGGEKQRVSLARCLCQNAKLLLLDEPTSFLDHKGKEDLSVLLQELCTDQAPTILVVSHDSSWVEQQNWETKELIGGQLC